MVTRTTIFADVKGTRMYKEGGEVKSDNFSISIPKCDTREKADKEINKMYRGQLVTVDAISFRFETRCMPDRVFDKMSTVKDAGLLDESELKAKAEHRKRK